MSYLWYWPSGGWDFNRWREGHTWEPARGPQSGRADLVPVVRAGGTLEEWEARRAELLRLTAELLGTVRDAPPAAPCWETLEERECGACRLRRIRYALTDREHGYAWLLTPRGAEDDARPRPAVLVLHQTVPQGKDEPAGLEGDAELALAREIAARGFVALAPDAVGFGERRMDHPHALYRSAEQFFAAHPDGSVMAKMALDAVRAVDLLCALPEVDPARIGCIGHSHGGYGTLFAMLHDPRIRAGAISCGVTALRTDPTPERWWRNTALIPRLGLYEGCIAQAPLDFHHWLALVAPRPLYVAGALDDAIFPHCGLPALLDRARPLWRLYGAGGNLRTWVSRGPHRFPSAARSRAYALLKEGLRGQAG